jgi:hypothetical protein
MKSGKQRREEIKARRRERAALLHGLDRYVPLHQLPLGAVAADAQQLVHNNTYGLLPLFYVDRPFACRDCSAHEVWTAKQQKWWYEIAKGPIDSIAVRCRPCRAKERERVGEARRRAGHDPA